MKSLLSILAYNEERLDNVKKILFSLAKYDSNNIVVCTKFEYIAQIKSLGLSQIQYIDCTNTNRPAAKNKIIKYAKEHGYSKLHIFEDDVVIHNSSFIKLIEIMMDAVGYSYVFNHLSNIQNYACGIIAPRLCIGNTIKELPVLDYYSYESKEYICIDIDKTQDVLLYYNEELNYNYNSFCIWQRRNFDITQMPFLNFYPFIEQEQIHIERSKDIPTTINDDIIELAEQELIKLNLKWEPDINVDDVLDYTANCIIQYTKNKEK